MPKVDSNALTLQNASILNQKFPINDINEINIYSVERESEIMFLINEIEEKRKRYIYRGEERVR